MGRGMRIVIVMMSAMGLFALVGLPFYVLPATDDPGPVDAVYVIGPPTDERIELAEAMIADGLTDTLVVSLNDEPEDRSRWEAAVAACDTPQSFTVYCSRPDPFTTRGEARWIRELVDQHEWTSVAVVTTTPHITRTRVIMERCWDGGFQYIDSEESMLPHLWAYQYIYQSAAFLKVWAEDGC